MLKISWVILIFALVATLNAEEKEECKKKPEGNPVECCAVSTPEKEKIHKCLNDLKDQTTEGCHGDCYFNGTEIFNNGKIDRTKLLAAIREHFVGADPGFEALHEKAVDHCIGVHEKMAEKHASAPKDSKCDRSKGGFAFCLHRFYFKNCPSTVWKDSETCNAWKKFSNECHGHHHHHHKNKE